MGQIPGGCGWKRWHGRGAAPRGARAKTLLTPMSPSLAPRGGLGALAAAGALICTKPPPRQAVRPVHAGSTAMPVGPLVVPLAPAPHPEPPCPWCQRWREQKRSCVSSRIPPWPLHRQHACPRLLLAGGKPWATLGFHSPRGPGSWRSGPLPAASSSFPLFPRGSDALMGTSVSTCAPSPSLAAPLTQPGPFPGWGWDGCALGASSSQGACGPVAGLGVRGLSSA